MADRTQLAYALLGLGLALGGALLALNRSAQRSFYAGEVYGLTQQFHRRFAACSGLAAFGFLAALRWPAIEIPLLAVYVLALILYASSFVRGFSGEDE